MDLNQDNSDIFQKNSKYIILSIVFFVLSLAGLFIFFKIKNNKPDISKAVSKPTLIPTIVEENFVTPTIEIIPTAIPTEIILTEPTLISTPTPEITVKPSPTVKPTSTPKPKPTLKPTTVPKPTIPVSTIRYENTDDKFSLNYVSYRKLYKEKEGNGNLYTFYSPKGSFAVHVSYGDWIWVNSERSFNNDFTINNLPTFRYDTNSQTLVDVENAGKKYTIQCVHNNNSSLKSECEDFIKSFRVL